MANNMDEKFSLTTGRNITKHTLFFDYKNKTHKLIK